MLTKEHICVSLLIVGPFWRNIKSRFPFPSAYQKLFGPQQKKTCCVWGGRYFWSSKKKKLAPPFHTVSEGNVAYVGRSAFSFPSVKLKCQAIKVLHTKHFNPKKKKVAKANISFLPCFALNKHKFHNCKSNQFWQHFAMEGSASQRKRLLW